MAKLSVPLEWLMGDVSTEDLTPEQQQAAAKLLKNPGIVSLLEQIQAQGLHPQIAAEAAAAIAAAGTRPVIVTFDTAGNPNPSVAHSVASTQWSASQVSINIWNYGQFATNSLVQQAKLLGAIRHELDAHVAYGTTSTALAEFNNDVIGYWMTFRAFRDLHVPRGQANWKFDQPGGGTVIINAYDQRAIDPALLRDFLRDKTTLLQQINSRFPNAQATPGQLTGPVHMRHLDPIAPHNMFDIIRESVPGTWYSQNQYAGVDVAVVTMPDGTTAYYMDSEAVVGNFNAILDAFAADNAIAENSQLSLYTVGLNGEFSVSETHFKGGVYGNSRLDVLTLNPWAESQIDSQTDLLRLNAGQALNLYTANWDKSVGLAGGIRDSLTGILIDPGILPQVAPTLSLNPFPNSPTYPLVFWDPSSFSNINNFSNSHVTIGAFYEAGTLVYDESLSIADKTAMLFDGTQPVEESAFDALDTNSDGVIDSQDSSYASLKVWQDMNEDGVVDAGEMKTLAQAGIGSISLNDKEVYTSGNAKSVVAEDVNALHDALVVSAPSAPSEPTPGSSAPTNSAPAQPNYSPGSNLTVTPDGQYLLGTNSGETFADSAASGVGYPHVPNMLGFGGDDTLIGEEINNNIWLGEGNDQFLGGAGNDQIIGDAGNEFGFAQVGDDSIWGGDGDDTLYGFYQSSDTLKTLGSGDTGLHKVNSRWQSRAAGFRCERHRRNKNGQTAHHRILPLPLGDKSNRSTSRDIAGNVVAVGRR
jgi:hypothetical protein